ncbi:MAG: thiamine-phosphate kinase [Thiogranum sp.]|nr:thiamine-phosphate kinase [Thiogranum sp.]
MSEFDVIERFFARQAPHRGDVVLGIGDDAAVLQPPAGCLLSVAVDTLVAGRHFPQATAPGDIGHKALAVNLSDLAAMGAEPLWATLALTIPDPDEAWLADFARGFFELANQHGVALVGGDTTRGPLSVTVQVMGSLHPEQVMRRDSAAPGQRIFVTGTPGDAAFALRQLQARVEVDAWLLERLNRPQPRVAFGRALAALGACAIDVSDGLLADLGHVLDASDCGAKLNVDRLPRSEALRDQPGDAVLECQLGGGDDYELCFSVDAGQVDDVRQLAAQHHLRVTEIGLMEAQSGIRCLHDDGSPCKIRAAGFDHFA